MIFWKKLKLVFDWDLALKIFFKVLSFLLFGIFIHSFTLSIGVKSVQQPLIGDNLIGFTRNIQTDCWLDAEPV